MNSANKLVKTLSEFMKGTNVVPIEGGRGYDCIPMIMQINAGGEAVRCPLGNDCHNCPLSMKRGTWEETLNEIKLEELLDE